MKITTHFMGNWNMTVDTEIAPTGKFRVGMNANNATLVIRSADGTVSGLSAELGRFIAGKLGVPFEPVVYESSTPFTASFRKKEWDIVLTGKNVVVAELLDFSADLYQTEYGYVAAPGHEFANPAEVDRPGVRIAVPRNASADVYLSRTLKSAALVRVDGNLDVGIEFLRAGTAGVYASSVDSTHAVAARMPGAKVVGAFHTVTFAVAMQKGRPAAALDQLTQMINEAKAVGIVQKALEQAGARGVRILP
ncbi:MAG: transporter substrate-binding domain-containing protein [Betaproteobacteria bacterium]|nr:transporter substrate-binding domain-containing protein [Betaproteobacteria bacterium]